MPVARSIAGKQATSSLSRRWLPAPRWETEPERMPSATTRISLTANRPMVRVVKSMPPSSSSEPKVKRSTPEPPSTPIMAPSSPRQIAAQVLAVRPCPMVASSAKASTISATYSAGPKETARRAMGTARKVSRTTVSVPPTKLPMPLSASAAAPRPCCASG